MSSVPLVNAECNTEESVVQMIHAIQQLDKLTQVFEIQNSATSHSLISHNYYGNIKILIFIFSKINIALKIATNYAIFLQAVFSKLKSRIEADLDRMSLIEERISQAREMVDNLKRQEDKSKPIRLVSAPQYPELDRLDGDPPGFSRLAVDSDTFAGFDADAEQSLSSLASKASLGAASSSGSSSNSRRRNPGRGLEPREIQVRLYQIVNIYPLAS